MTQIEGAARLPWRAVRLPWGVARLPSYRVISTYRALLVATGQHEHVAKITNLADRYVAMWMQ